MASDRWRDWVPPAAPAEKARSNGINPCSFYKKLRNNEKETAAEKQLDNILALAAREEIVQKRHEFTSEQKVQREAYHAVTSFKVFPLQDLAMEYLSEMMNEYVGQPKLCSGQLSRHDGIFDNEGEKSCDNVADRHDLSLNLCKRRKLGGMDTLSKKYTDIFLAEKHYLPMIENRSNRANELNYMSNGRIHQITSGLYSFLPELWSMEPRIFAVETSSTGKRKYIVANLGRFLQHYWRETDPRSRHFYELIPEGTPCRLYFDLEFCKKSNPQINSDESEMLMTEFIDELCSEFHLIFGIQISRSCIIDLDASTDKKFSRHLIIHLPNGELFADACSAGVFAKRFVGRLAEELSTGTLEGRRATLAKHLFVRKHSPKASDREPLSSDRGFDNKAYTCFVDLGVYTRNRLFRLMGSAKFGKHVSSALRLADANRFCFPAGFDNNKFYRTDLVSHDVTNTDESNASSNQSQNHDSFCAALDWESHARALSLTLVVPSNASKINSPILTESSSGGKSPGTKMLDSFSTRLHRQSKPRTCIGDSPLPKLDAFILSISRRGGIQGKIRAWSMVGSNMSYQMSENRWCENIGREHKSNNVIWNIDMACKTFWQTCHDPECRAANYRGSTKELPADVGTAVSDYMLDEELATLDEDKIIREAKKVEATQQGVQGLLGSSTDFSDPELDSALGDIDMSLFRSR